ncbi:MAG TPA: hypothetical protein VF423_03565 [Actinomycetes bacterium]
MRMLVRLAVLAVMLVLGTALASPAAAATTDVPRPSDGTYRCADGTTAVLPVDKGAFSPGRIVETGQLFRPLAFTFTLAIGGEDPPSTALSVSKKNVPVDAVTCTTTVLQVDELGNIIGVLTYSVTGSLKG